MLNFSIPDNLGKIYNIMHVQWLAFMVAIRRTVSPPLWILRRGETYFTLSLTYDQFKTSRYRLWVERHKYTTTRLFQCRPTWSIISISTEIIADTVAISLGIVQGELQLCIQLNTTRKLFLVERLISVSCSPRCNLHLTCCLLHLYGNTYHTLFYKINSAIVCYGNFSKLERNWYQQLRLIRQRGAVELSSR